MGTSASVTQLSSKLTATSGAIARAQRVGVAQAALAGKETMIAGAVAAGLPAGGPIPRHRGKRWNARYGLVGVANPTALLGYVGPVHWVLRGTKPHVIVPRAAKGARRAVRAASALGVSALSGSTGSTARLSTPYGPRPSVNHPGMRGRNTWPATSAQIVAQSARIVAAATKRALLEAF